MKPIEHKLQWVSSAWSGLIAVLLVSVFRGSKGAKQPFSAHPHPTMPCTATAEKSAFFPATIFPMVSLQRTYLRHWIYQTSWEWKHNSKRIGKVNQFIEHNSLLKLTTLLFASHVSVSAFKKNLIFEQLSSSTNNSPFSVTICWSVTWCFLFFWKQWANQKAVPLCLHFLLYICMCEWLVWPRGKHSTCRSA